MLVDRKSWPVHIVSGEPKVLGTHLPPGVVVLHNRGPGAIRVETGYTNISVILTAGETQITPILDRIGLASLDLKPATLEFEFMLVPK